MAIRMRVGSESKRELRARRVSALIPLWVIHRIFFIEEKKLTSSNEQEKCESPSSSGKNSGKCTKTWESTLNQ
jgi:hypothetical protein